MKNKKHNYIIDTNDDDLLDDDLLDDDYDMDDDSNTKPNDISESTIQSDYDDISDSEIYTEDEADAVFDAAEKKQTHNNLLRKVILLIAGVVFIYAAYNLVNIFLEYKKGDDIYNSIDKDVLEDETQKSIIVDENGNEQEVEIPFTYNHQSLLSINPEGIGYLYVPSINLRLPMVQTTDNDFYLTRTFDKSYNGNGCLFEDYRIKGGLSASHVIIYGHNMNNGAMFGNLAKYKSYSFWDNGSNDFFYIYTENKIMEYRIFSVYTSEPISDTYTFNFSTIDSMRDYAKNMKAKSDYDTGVSVDDASQVVTFSTCTKDGKQRFIVHGVYVGEAPLSQ